jgi:hypothetical protein
MLVIDQAPEDQLSPVLRKRQIAVDQHQFSVIILLRKT